MEAGPVNGGSKCQIFMAMPPAKMVLQGFIGGLNDVKRAFARHPDDIARELGHLNDMLLHEAARLNVTPPATMPDP